jgi:uncharacterized protein (DUF849 family)
MPTTRKVIITSAVTGAIHTPSMSKYLPVSAEEIAEAALGAVEAGAAIVHLHARHPEDGRPSQDPAHFVPILETLKQHTDAVINLTTGGSPHMTVAERMRPAVEFKPELASLNMGSMNFGLYPMLNRFREFEYDWERQALENSRDLVFKNTFADIQTILELGRANGTRFEFECYDCETGLRRSDRRDPCYDWPCGCPGVDLSAGPSDTPPRLAHRAGSDLIGA